MWRVLSIGRRIERTLEVLNWVLIVSILGGFLVLAVFFVPAGTWQAAVAGLSGFDVARGTFNFLPAEMDFFLLGALVAYSGVRRRRQPHLVELGAGQGLRHGGAGGLHPRRDRRSAR